MCIIFLVDIATGGRDGGWRGCFMRLGGLFVASKGGEHQCRHCSTEKTTPKSTPWQLGGLKGFLGRSPESREDGRTRDFLGRAAWE